MEYLPICHVYLFLLHLSFPFVGGIFPHIDVVGVVASIVKSICLEALGKSTFVRCALLVLSTLRSRFKFFLDFFHFTLGNGTWLSCCFLTRDLWVSRIASYILKPSPFSSPYSLLDLSCKFTLFGVTILLWPPVLCCFCHLSSWQDQ